MEVRRLEDPATFERLDRVDLSDWFNPFLPTFARDAARSGGAVRIVVRGDEVVGLAIAHPNEKVVSIFARTRRAAEKLRREDPVGAAFCEIELEPVGEVFWIFRRPVRGPEPDHRFRHAVRTADPSETGEIARRMREEYGQLDDRWLLSASEEGETCFVAVAGDDLAGVAWACVRAQRARLHSLVVAPRYRRLGVATDLLMARLLWARTSGATDAILEISEHNHASQEVAGLGGFRPAGRIFWMRPTHGPRVGPAARP